MSEATPRPNDMTPVIPEGFDHYVEDWGMSPAVICNGFVFLTGMTGAGPGGDVSSDPRVQIELAFMRTATVLEAARCSFADVVEMTSYHVNIAAHIDVFRDVRAGYVASPYPAWTAIEVAGFVTPGTLIELRVVARARED